MDDELYYEGEQLYAIAIYGKQSYDFLPYWYFVGESNTRTILPESKLDKLKEKLAWERENNPDFEFRIVKLVDIGA